MLIILKRHKIKSCKYIKIDLKTNKYTENIPKIYCTYNVQKNSKTGQNRPFPARRRMPHRLGGTTGINEACASLRQSLQLPDLLKMQEKLQIYSK